MKTRTNFLAILMPCIMCALPQAALCQEKITVEYNIRPPYQIANADGSASGLVGTPAGNAFRHAGVPFVWAEVPTNRQLQEIQRNVSTVCGLGWFKNPEREQFAKFTKALYRDSPNVALVNRGFAPAAGATLEEVLATKNVRVLVKDKYSYGPYIDGLLARYQPEQVSTTGENRTMLAMLRGNRADLMFIAEEEAKYLFDQPSAKAGKLRVIRFTDVPKGEKRYIMCSKSVPDEVIRALDSEISFE